MATKKPTDLKARVKALGPCVENDGGYRAITDDEIASLTELESADDRPNVEEAAEKIRDAIRYTGICAAALDSDRSDERLEVWETLGTEVWTALQDALVALRVTELDEIGVYRDVDPNAAAAESHAK